jgi:isopenicillin N synthase-like dioxygenase
MPDDNEILEMRLTKGGNVVPHAINDHLPELREVRNSLFELSRTVIGAVEAYVGMQQDSLVKLLDDGDKLREAEWSSTQHRICLYHANSDVPFEAHTDTTFLTLIPCSSVAGLEVWTAATGWVRPEEHVESDGAVIVLPGELLQVLTAGVFSAAVHRVTRFSSSGHAAKGERVSRLSMPLLVRGVKQAVVDVSDLMPAQPQDTGKGGDNGDALYVRRALERLEGVSMFDLHRTLVFGMNVKQP